MKSGNVIELFNMGIQMCFTYGLSLLSPFIPEKDHPAVGNLLIYMTIYLIVVDVSYALLTSFKLVVLHLKRAAFRQKVRLEMIEKKRKDEANREAKKSEE